MVDERVCSDRINKISLAESYAVFFPHGVILYTQSYTLRSELGTSYTFTVIARQMANTFSMYRLLLDGDEVKLLNEYRIRLFLRQPRTLYNVRTADALFLLGHILGAEPPKIFSYALLWLD